MRRWTRGTLVEWMLADGLPARLSLQIHKFIWEPMKKGVLTMCCAAHQGGNCDRVSSRMRVRCPASFAMWRERGAAQELPFAQGYRPFWLSEAGVLGVVRVWGRRVRRRR